MKFASHWLFFGVALLLLTNAKILVGYYAGLPGLTSIYFVFMPLLGICLLLRAQTLKVVLIKKQVMMWVCIMFFVPSTITVMHFLFGFVGFRDVIFSTGKALFYTMLFVACATYGYAADFRKDGFFLYAIFIIIGTVALELLVPSYVAMIKASLVEDLALSHFENYDRGLGFFLNANQLGMACVLCAMGFLSGKMHVSKGPALLITALFFVVVISGSRTSFLVIVAVISARFWHFATRTGSLKQLLTGLLRFVSIGLLLFFAFDAFLYVSGASNQTQTAIERLVNLPEVLLSVQTTDDGSVRLRVDQLGFYMSRVWDNWLIGRGSAYVKDLVLARVVDNASQNSFIDYALVYGIPYACMLILAFVAMYRKAWQSRRLAPTVGKTVQIFVIVSILYVFSIDFMLAVDPYVIVLGLTVAESIVSSRSAGMTLGTQRQVSVGQGSMLSRDMRVSRWLPGSVSSTPRISTDRGE